MCWSDRIFACLPDISAIQRDDCLDSRSAADQSKRIIVGAATDKVFSLRGLPRTEVKEVHEGQRFAFGRWTGGHLWRQDNRSQGVATLKALVARTEDDGLIVGRVGGGDFVHETVERELTVDDARSFDVSE